jgi:hypothetical protein
MSDTPLSITSGHAFFCVAIAAAKRMLADVPMKAGERLHWLERINRAADCTLQLR